MDLKQCMNVVIVLCSIFAFLIFFIVAKSAKRRKFDLMSKTESFMKRNSERSVVDYFNYYRIQDYLIANGIEYNFDGKITPVRFIVIKFASALLSAFAVYKLVSSKNMDNIILLVLVIFTGAIVGFFLIDGIIYVSNKEDNEKMSDDIYNIYVILGMHGTAGVYMKDSILECFKETGNKRLKQALVEFYGELVLKNNFLEGLEVFQGKFNNEQIDSLCIILRSSQKSGKSVQALKDFSKQMQDMEDSANLAYESKQETRIDMLTIFIMIGIMSIIIFGCAYQLNIGLNHLF